MKRRIVAIAAALVISGRLVWPADPALAQAAALDASQATPPPAASSHRTFVDLTINREPAGKVLAIFGDGGVLLTRADLQQDGIPTTGATCVTVAQACYIALDTLKPAIAYTFDEASLSVAITTSAALLPKKDVALGVVAPEMSDVHVRGNVLNYSVNAVPQQQVGGTLDDRFGIAANEVLEGGVGKTTSGLVERTYTDLTIDDLSTERRTIVGDATASGGDLGGTFALGGIVIQRQFSLDPYAITYPTPTLQTAITQPSQAAIYVNGVLIKTVDLPPGYYTLSNIPVIAGISNAQVVIRNSFGQTTFDTGTYGAISLLRKGLTDYQYGIGFVRENVGLPDESYGPAVGTANYRIGLSDQATIGGLIQSSDGVTDAGTDYDAQIGAGVIHAGASASMGSFERSGLNGALAYTSTTPRSSFAVALQEQSKNYTPVSSFAPQFSALGSAAVYWSRQLSRELSVNISEQITRYLAEGSVAQTSLGFMRQMGAWSVSGAYSIGTTPPGFGSPGGTTRSFSMALIRTIGSHANTTTTEALNVQTGPNAASGYELTSSALTPLDSSYDAVVQTKPGGGVGFGGWANLASPYGTLQLFASPGSSISALSGSLDGAIVSTSKGTFFTQSVPDAYALVDTGVPGAEVYLSGMYVGKTGPNGAMVVPFLQSNFANNISVSSHGLPLTEILMGPGNDNVGPSYHNGALIKNHVERVHALVGKLLFQAENGDVVPMYGDARLELSPKYFQSPIDADGRVYFQGVVPGTYGLTISVPGKTCATSVKVPDFSGPTYNFGTLRCKI